MIQVDLQGNIYDCQIEQNHSVIATKFYSLEKQIELKDKEIEGLKEELKYSISIVEHNKTIQSNINSYNKLAKYSSDLEDRIDKAIEYIKDNLYPVGNDVNGSDLPYDEAIQPLVDILKGDDKE